MPLQFVAADGRIRADGNSAAGGRGSFSGAPLLILAPPTFVALAAVAQTIGSITAPKGTANSNKYFYRVHYVLTITVHGSESINCQIAFTDDGNTSRPTLNVPLAASAAPQTLAAAANTADIWTGSYVFAVTPNTSITLATAGTFTGATYNVSAVLEQLR
jgi:hypothetical protein